MTSEAKERERHWQKQQVQGELDETRLVDGLAGARNIYRRRGEAEQAGGDQLVPKRVKFVMDCSGTSADSGPTALSEHVTLDDP